MLLFIKNKVFSRINIIISKFFEIQIRFNNNNKYSKAHFYAEYNDYKVVVDIVEGRVIEGYMPRKQLILVLGWYEMHQDELIQNYSLMTEGLETYY